MSLSKSLGLIVLYGALVQFIYWTFTKLKLDENILDILPIIISNLTAILMILVIMVMRLQRRRKIL